MEQFTRQAAYSRARHIDGFIHDRLKQCAPIVFFFVSRPIFKFLWPVFGMRINQKPDKNHIGESIELFIWGNKSIGTMLLTRVGEEKLQEVIGPTGIRLGDMKPNYAIEDFKEGYQPHVMCIFGAMCEQCGSNLKKS